MGIKADENEDVDLEDVKPSSTKSEEIPEFLSKFRAMGIRADENEEDVAKKPAPTSTSKKSRKSAYF